jgi:hypothetical protein
MAAVAITAVGPRYNGFLPGTFLPMVAWMLVRGVGRRNAYELAASMVLPVILSCPGLVRRRNS